MFNCTSEEKPCGKLGIGDNNDIKNNFNILSPPTESPNGLEQNIDLTKLNFKDDKTFDFSSWTKVDEM